MSKLNQHTGLWININVLTSNLSPIEKLVLADIVALCSSGNEFFKTNKVMAETFNVSLRTINYSVSSLVSKELIVSFVTTPYGNIKKKRVISVNKNYLKNLKKL